MKKTLALVMLAGLMLTGCGSKQASAQTETAKATAVAENTIEVPDVVGLTLDKAIDQLQSIGLKAHATDVDEGKTIIIKKKIVSTTTILLFLVRLNRVKSFFSALSPLLLASWHPLLERRE